MSTIKACPFCGGLPQVIVDPEDVKYRVDANRFIQCSICGARSAAWGSLNILRNEWNKRHGLVEESPMIPWYDIHSGTIVLTLSEDKPPLIHGFTLKGPQDRREYYRISQWVKLKDFFRKKAK